MCYYIKINLLITQGTIPLPFRLKEFVLLPKQEMLHCVFQKVSPGNGLTKYILYLEFLGASIPLLVASRNRSVKYEYLIYDPTFSQLTDSGFIIIIIFYIISNNLKLIKPRSFRIFL